MLELLKKFIFYDFFWPSTMSVYFSVDGSSVEDYLFPSSSDAFLPDFIFENSEFKGNVLFCEGPSVFPGVLELLGPTAPLLGSTFLSECSIVSNALWGAEALRLEISGFSKTFCLTWVSLYLSISLRSEYKISFVCAFLTFSPEVEAETPRGLSYFFWEWYLWNGNSALFLKLAIEPPI